MEQLLCDRLATILDLRPEETSDIAKYVASMEEFDEVKEYVEDIVDTSHPDLPELLADLKVGYAAKSSNSIIYRKKTVDDQPKSKANKNKAKSKTVPVVNLLAEPGPKTPVDAAISTAQPIAPQISPSKSKKAKFVPLLSGDGQARASVQLPGRHSCECQAVKHALVNNCLGCGRIVCQQEGSGPCLFCGQLVCTESEREVLARGSRKSAALREKLMSIGGGASGPSSTVLAPGERRSEQSGLQKARAHKEKLLEFDKTSARRTQVIDDESDYFNTSSQWLSTEERDKLRKREEQLREKRYGSRLGARKITLDFAGRQIVDEDKEEAENMYSREDEIVKEVFYGGDSAAVAKDIGAERLGIVNPNILRDAPMFVCTVKDNAPVSQRINREEVKVRNRIQDSGLLEMTDAGMCLSMHQPWASLLVAGIKRHEGRDWYSDHRGRLWIAATAKQPTDEEILHMEQFYSHFYSGKQIQFPDSYPSGCLLGCVNVQDVLHQDEYKEQYPDGESQSPNVFICSDPQSLLVKFPIKGKHKIYKLDKRIHEAATRGLLVTEQAVR